MFANDTEQLFHEPLCYLNDEWKCQLIDTVRRLGASLALLGCIFMIFILWLLQVYKQFTHRLILYLAICGCIHSASFLFNSLTSSSAACKAQGWLLFYSECATLFWICCITFNIYMNAVKMEQTVQHELKYHVISWGIPLMISLVPFVANVYGPAGFWCWIVDNVEWRFGIWYGPLSLVICILFIVYPYIIWRVYQLDRDAELGQLDPIIQRSMIWMLNDVKPLIAYPIVYLIAIIFPLMNRIQNCISKDPIFAFVLLHAIFSPLESTLNAIVYALNKDVLWRLRPSQMKIALENRFRRTPELIQESEHVSNYKSIQGSADC